MRIRANINPSALALFCLTLFCQASISTIPRVSAQGRIRRGIVQSPARTSTTISKPVVAGTIPALVAPPEPEPPETNVALAPGTGQLIISEYRLRGTQGANDEFIEIYNNTDAAHVVAAIDASAGYALVSSSNTTLNDGDPTVRCIIPNGTTIPARGHFLCINATPLTGYSLATYPAGHFTSAIGDAVYTADIPDNDGVALFNNADPSEAAFTLANRLDAVGASDVNNVIYREGSGHNSITPFSIDYSWVRRLPGACTGSLGSNGDNCNSLALIVDSPGPSSSHPQDSDDNQSDFIFIDTSGSPGLAGQRLGAPAPENLSAPTARDSRPIVSTSVDGTAAASSTPNRIRDEGAIGANRSFGTLEIRRRFKNDTGAGITRLRFRIVDITTLPNMGTNCSSGAPGSPTDCTADLRALSSIDTTITSNDANTCATTPGASLPTAPCTIPLRGTTLEEAMLGISSNQPNGGGFNSSLSAGQVTLAQPLAPGQSINVRFLLGVQAIGKFRFFVSLEALP